MPAGARARGRFGGSPGSAPVGAEMGAPGAEWTTVGCRVCLGLRSSFRDSGGASIASPKFDQPEFGPTQCAQDWA